MSVDRCQYGVGMFDVGGVRKELRCFLPMGHRDNHMVELGGYIKEYVNTTKRCTALLDVDPEMVQVMQGIGGGKALGASDWATMEHLRTMPKVSSRKKSIRLQCIEPHGHEGDLHHVEIPKSNGEIVCGSADAYINEEESN